MIHEGQLTYREMGLHKVVDLGEWWLERNGLPLPLGGNVIRRDLGNARWIELMDIRRSIQYGLDHREEAMAYAIQFSRGLDRNASIDSSACTSTSSRSITARKADRPSRSCLVKPTKQADSRTHHARLCLMDERRRERNWQSDLWQQAYQRQMNKELDEAVELYKKSIDSFRRPRPTRFWAGPTAVWAASRTRLPNVTRRSQSILRSGIPTTISVHI